MKKLLLLFTILFTCALFNSQLSAQQPTRTVDIGTQVTAQTVFYVNFYNSTCVGYPAHFVKVTANNTGSVGFRFAADSDIIRPGESFVYTMGEKFNSSMGSMGVVEIKGVYKK